MKKEKQIKNHFLSFSCVLAPSLDFAEIRSVREAEARDMWIGTIPTRKKILSSVEQHVVERGKPTERHVVIKLVR